MERGHRVKSLFIAEWSGDGPPRSGCNQPTGCFRDAQAGGVVTFLRQKGRGGGAYHFLFEMKYRPPSMSPRLSAVLAMTVGMSDGAGTMDRASASADWL